MTELEREREVVAKRLRDLRGMATHHRRSSPGARRWDAVIRSIDALAARCGIGVAA